MGAASTEIGSDLCMDGDAALHNHVLSTAFELTLNDCNDLLLESVGPRAKTVRQ